MKATATANANIALVKYWGNRDRSLVLPFNNSISMTCDGLAVRTTVDFSHRKSHEVTINGSLVSDDRIINHMDFIKKLAGIEDYAHVASVSNFPPSAGLASSAAGLAALTLAAAKAAGLSITGKQASIIARHGSGSASRSIFEGFVEWEKGRKKDGSDSFSRTIAPCRHWPKFRMIACIVTENKKHVSSREGMAQTVATSPYYRGWLDSVEEDLRNVRKGIRTKNFGLVGSTAESNALKMHAAMMTTRPALIYWWPATLDIIHAILELRSGGTEAYFTMDAGPQVKVLCMSKDVGEVQDKINEIKSALKTVVCKPGKGAELVHEHLF